MDIRTNGSYVYFLIDDNLVFSYKIESLTYISLHELRNSQHSAIYDLESYQKFQDFEHENREPIQGRGIFLGEESLKEIITQINKVIKMQKKTQKIKGKKAIHLVATEQIASQLIVDLNEQIEVIGLDAALTFGPLQQLNEHYGQMERSEWFYENINREYEEESPYMITLVNKINSMDDMNEERPVYIWCGNNIEEQLALRFFTFLFETKPNPLYLINTSDLLKKKVTSKEQVVHTAQLKSEELKAIFNQIDNENIISPKTKERLITEWLAIANAKELLRIWRNQAILPVAIDYYDHKIVEAWKRMHAEEQIDYIMTSQLIWETMEEENLFIDHNFLEYRIRHLVYSGVFEMKGIPKNRRRYFVRLK